MILSPHLLMAKDGRYVVVVRHPEGIKPNALRHDVLYIAGKLVRSQQLSDAERVERLLAAARAWIATAGPEDRLDPLPGYGLVDRLRRYKAAHAAARRERATLLRELRGGRSFRDAVARYGKNRVDKILARWPRLREKIGKPKRGYDGERRRPPGPNTIRRRLEAEWERAEAEAARDGPDRTYWLGRSALARELLGLWTDRQDRRPCGGDR